MTTPTDRFYELSPLKQLILEVLGARYRLGHELWTFTKNQGVSKALRELEENKLVYIVESVIERTIRAGLTEDGATLVLDPDYVPPILEK